jgi:hypothetical protein
MYGNLQHMDVEIRLNIQKTTIYKTLCLSLLCLILILILKIVISKVTTMETPNSPHTTSPNDTLVIQPTQAPPQTPTRYCLSRRSCKSPASGGSRRARIGAPSPRRVDLGRFFVTWWLDWEAREVGAVGLFLCGSRNGSRWVRAVCGVMLRDADFDGRVRGCV